jgi:hypothetical protein
VAKSTAKPAKKPRTQSRSFRILDHVVVYRNEQEFAAWPWNGGMWQFADGEIAVGFFTGPCDYRTPGSTDHKKVDTRHLMVRSRDGGRTWLADSVTSTFEQASLAATLRTSSPAVKSDQRFDPRADGFCVLGGFGIPPEDAMHLAYAMVSTDRGHHWTGPMRLPAGIVRLSGFKLLAARPSVVVRPDGMLLLFAHGVRNPPNSDFGWEVALSVGVVYGSWNGGASWGIVGEITADSAGPGVIMPYPLLLKNGSILAACRRQYDGYNAHTSVHRSDDGGRTWRFIARVNDWGAPANLVQMPDGRIVCVYGYRQQPWGVRARVSRDEGRTWGEEIVLRDDGGSWDVGYPRTVLRPDGTLVTVYYFNRKDDPTQFDGGVRHIAATLWRV